MKITEILAIYAAFLSTVVFFWNISRATPNYKVDVLFGVDTEEEEPRHGIYIFVRNPSPHTVHLANIDILYPYENRGLIDRILHILRYRRPSSTIGWAYSSLSNYGLNDGCPVALQPGKSHKVFIAHETVEQILEGNDKRIIRASVQDQLWREKHSKVFVYPKKG